MWRRSTWKYTLRLAELPPHKGFLIDFDFSKEMRAINRNRIQERILRFLVEGNS